MKVELRKNGWKDDSKLIQFTAPVSPGSSGGPLFNAKGEVVAIVFAGMLSANNVYWASPVEAAKKCLANETVIAFQPETDSNNIQIEDVTPRRRGNGDPSIISPSAGSMVIVAAPEGIGLNFHTGPSLRSGRVVYRKLISDGEFLTVLSRNGDWIRVETSDKYVGYVRWRYKGVSYVQTP